MVAPNVITPKRCHKCEKLGHTKKWCTNGKEVCAHCGQVYHNFSAYTYSPKCANSHQSHAANSKYSEVYTRDISYISKRCKSLQSLMKSQLAITRQRIVVTRWLQTDKLVYYFIYFPNSLSTSRNKTANHLPTTNIEIKVTRKNINLDWEHYISTRIITLIYIEKLHTIRLTELQFVLLTKLRKNFFAALCNKMMHSY